MTDTGKGLIAVAGSSVIWGLFPLYVAMASRAGIPATEIVAHRILWTLVLFGAFLALRGRLAELRAALRGRNLMLTCVAAVLVSANWWIFIWGVGHGYAVQASVGYYLLPLVMAGLARLILGERLSGTTCIALALAGVAVAVLTLGLGVTPWLALAVAISFGLYSIVKRRIAAGPVVSVTGEVVVLAPLALLWLLAQDQGHFTASASHAAMLIGFGVLTGVPLILFSRAAKLAPLGLVGLVSYLNPTLQLIVAASLLGGQVTRWHLIALALIWAGLTLVTVQALRAQAGVRAARNAAARVGTSSTAVK
ncbi:EamA family transporter RarD [Paracoccus sp. p4-l81]|uniref:EamA family transporter RarD n=1 Tax=unclassified Paracoccus (in: a-proteobacteria) TaxID=2688777 RepID=UPI0035B813B5